MGEAVDEGEAGLLDVLALEPFTLEVDTQRVVPVRRPTEVEAAGGVTVEVPGPEVLAPGAALGRFDEQAVVERDRGADDLAETLLALAVLADGDVVVTERDAGAARQPFDGLDEVEVLDLPDERDRVAALLTTEAVINRKFGIDRERGSLLGVERTQAHEPAADALEGDVLPGQRHQVGRLADPGDVVVEDAHRASG